ncbi:MAG: FAD-dependent oxidoreductase, partial [Gammaproteobacteria bacterium]
GYIAVEFAGIFAGFGCKVSQIYRGDLFLRGFDTEVRHFLAKQMRDKGINLRFNQDVRDITRADSNLTVNLKSGESIACDCVMYATGRRPNSADLGLAEAGVSLDRNGAVQVDEEYRTTIPSICAVGDVTDRVNLTPVALAEGMVVARRLFGGRETAVDYDYIPTAVFSQPPIGTVGFTEDEARERFGAVSIFTSTFTPLRYTVSEEKETALMKLVVATDTNRVVGIHLCGEDAGEITQGFAVAMRAGATKEMFDSTIGIHPTAAEELVTMRDPVR